MISDNPRKRFDSQFFGRRVLAVIEAVRRTEHGKIAVVAGKPLKGRSVEYSEGGLIKIIRSGDVSKSVNDAALLRANSDQPVFRLKHGDVLISSIGFGSIGKVHLFDQGDGYGTVSEVTVIRQSVLPPAFLAAFLAGHHGQLQIERQITGATGQLHLLPDDVGRVYVPIGFAKLQERVADCYLKSIELRRTAKAQIDEAEVGLLTSLDLRNWSPPEPLTYTRAAAALSANKRLDAEFAAPKVQALLELLSRDGLTVGSVAPVRRETFRPKPPGSFQYIEIGSLDGFGRCASSTLDLAEAPSRATWHVRAGDVVTSTVRPLRRLSAIIAPDQDGYVCSSGFVVLDPTKVSPELLMTYLRLPLVCELMNLFATASMYPALSEVDLLALPMPHVPEEVDRRVQQLVRESALKLQEAEGRLAAAKHAVEIAIEDGEVAALRFLSEQGEGTDACSA